MANNCENTLTVFSETPENIEYIKEFFNNRGNIDQDDSCNLKIYFNSEWNFPKEEMEELFKGIPYKDDIQMVCLSVEWGCFYCAFHYCDEEGWKYQN